MKLSKEILDARRQARVELLRSRASNPLEVENTKLRAALKNLVNLSKTPCTRDEYEAWKVAVDEAREVLGEGE